MKKSLRFFFLLSLVFPTVFYGQELENPGFENWEDVGSGIIEPVDWSSTKTSDDPGISALAPLTFDRSEDAHSGNYSLAIYNVKVFANLIATGALTNGRFHADFNFDSAYSYTQADDPQWNTPFTTRPDSLTGWFKYFPKGNDIAQFKVVLHVDECKLPANGTLPNWVGIAIYSTDHGVTYENWTRFSVPFTYFNDYTPEYVLTVLNSGDSTNVVDSSFLLIDDLHLINPEAGISDLHYAESFLFVADNRLVVNLKSEQAYLHQWFYLIDAAGQTVLTEQLENNQIILPGSLPQGVYVAVLKTNSQQYVQKVMIR